MKHTGKPRLTYASLEEDPSYEHPVDRRVRRRVNRPDLDRVMAKTTTSIVRALGKKKALWFKYERAWDDLRARRESAYFDVGVEHGVAGCAVHGLGRAGKKVRAIASWLVRELYGTGADRDDAIKAAVVAVWALGSADIGKRPVR